MSRLTEEDLRLSTLARQFPAIDGLGPDAVLELFRRLGPIQSQVPRAPFLTASSRLPGVGYGTVCDLFEEHRLLKTSSLRGTVHTTGREHFPLTDAVARRQRAGWIRAWLKLERVTPEELFAEVEDFTTTAPQPRAEIVAHGKSWLAERESRAAADLVGPTVHPASIWGHSGLIRRPRDTRWEKRTDIFHQRARSVLPDLPLPDFDAALQGLVRVHLGAYGPAQREDIAFFSGAGLSAVDAAVTVLGDEVVRLRGHDDVEYLDLAEPPVGGSTDLGLRLLPEFEGLLVGFQGRNRFRFLNEHQLPKVWAKVNGLFSPVVLHDGRLVASWKTITKGRRTDIEVSMLDPHPPLADDEFGDAVAATERVLDLTITDIRVRAAER